MTQTRLYATALMVLGSAIAACEAPAALEREGSTTQHQTGDTVDATSLFTDGFEVVAPTSCSAESAAADCSFSLRSDTIASAVEIGGGLQIASSPFRFGLGLNDKETVGSYTIYKWPAKLGDRSYDDIAAQMREYSTLVGTLLHREAKGPGEEKWADYLRSRAFTNVVAAAGKGTTAFCGAVVKNFVQSMVPEGSDYRQYGNCGEGGHVGACLAHKAGFADDEIRVCASDNDHFFAMVKHSDAAKKWCILDRWPLIASDNYACGVDWDATDRTVTHEGTAVDQDWFKKVTCTTLGGYLKNGASVE